MRIGQRIGQYRIGAAEDAAELRMRPSGSAVIKYYIAGVGRTSLPVGTAINVISTGAMLRVFRAERLVVNGDNASAFSIVDAKSGADSAFVNLLGIPANLFKPDAWAVSLSLPTTAIGTALSLSVTNDSLSAQVFSGGWLGYAAIVPV